MPHSFFLPLVHLKPAFDEYGASFREELPAEFRELVPRIVVHEDRRLYYLAVAIPAPLVESEAQAGNPHAVLADDANVRVAGEVAHQYDSVE